MKHKELYQQFNHHIQTAQKILITAHQYPDIDAIGSCLALAEAIKKNKTVKVWIPKNDSKEWDCFPKFDYIEKDFPNNFKFDTCIVCDCSNLERVDQYEHISNATHTFTTINIDHHSDNNYFGDINIVKTISSVGELLYELFQHLNIPISSPMAICLYAAISFDTGRFAYSNVTEKTLETASKLVKLGATPYVITQAMEENKSEKDFQLIKIAIDNLVINNDAGFAYTTIPKRSPKGSIKIIDFIRQLKDIDLLIVFQELQSKLVKVNLRSKSEINVSKIAQQFGGGGHDKAAGIVLKKDLETCQAELIQYIQSR
ncbi:hypothetical protein CL658_03100 [bacterium]|nr:hypothetical protein [bacterium]|tara:strand:- start:3879 stop:4823 length:945 start_codon:yes stop_codon:yes gene_type:complete